MKNLLERFKGYKIQFTLVENEKKQTKNIEIENVTKSFNGYTINIKGIGRYPINNPKNIVDNGNKVIFDYSDNFLKAETMSRGGQTEFSKKTQNELMMEFSYSDKDYQNYQRDLELTKKYGW